MLGTGFLLLSLASTEVALFPRCSLSLHFSGSKDFSFEAKTLIQLNATVRRNFIVDNHLPLKSFDCQFVTYSIFPLSLRTSLLFSRLLIFLSLSRRLFAVSRLSGSQCISFLFAAHRGARRAEEYCVPLLLCVR